MPIRERLLLVDGDEDSRIIFSAVLAYHGFDASAVSTADEGLRAIERNPPDVVITAIELPSHGGIGLLHTIREQPALADVPVIALTSHVMPDERRLFARLGFDLVLYRPLDPVALVDAVLRAVRDHRSRQSVC
jgi:CheY-like chemotaxis protein